MINEILVPRINTNDDHVQIVRWHFKSGDYVAKGSTLVDIETSKTVVSVEADLSGYLDASHDVGKIVQVGKRLCYLKDDAGEVAEHSEPKNSAAENMEQRIASGAETIQSLDEQDFDSEEIDSMGIYESTRFSRAAKKLLQEMGLNAESFSGKGLVTSNIILNRKKSKPLGGSDSQVYIKKNSIELKGPIVPREMVLPLSKRSEISQLTIGEQGLINSSLSISFDSAVIRTAIGEDAIFANFQALILYEIAQLLPQWPQFTAYYEADEIRFYDRIDLGVAIDLGMGLKVVRIKDAEALSAAEISEITLDYCLRYMRNEIQPDELVGSTITVTDLSSQDILYFHPLINGHQSAIIGIGGDSAKPQFPMAINMTFDHRVTTGREVAQFLKELRARILAHRDSETRY